ncbi:MAG: GpE family phage tail protein [Treponema sp.]|nr:GpE family phage tail protein [Candidatus Treponema caballi]
MFHFPPSETEKWTIGEMKYWFDRAMDYLSSFGESRKK